MTQTYSYTEIKYLEQEKCLNAQGMIIDNFNPQYFQVTNHYMPCVNRTNNTRK